MPHLFGDILPPLTFCSRIVLENYPTALCFGWHAAMEPGDVRVIKHITFSACIEATAAQANIHLCSIYCHTIKVDEFCLNGRDDALMALKKADELLLCPCCTIEPVAVGQYAQLGAAHFEKNCCLTTPDGKPCLRCRYTRKLIQNRTYRFKKKCGMAFKQEIARKSLQLFRARKKLVKAQKIRRPEQSQTISSSFLEEKIRGLPSKRCLAVSI